MSEATDQGSWRQLLDAVLTIGSDLDLPAMSRRIVSSAVDLVDATYGALGVLDESRTRLAEFITVGIDDATIGRSATCRRVTASSVCSSPTPGRCGCPISPSIPTASASPRTTRRCGRSSACRSASGTRSSATSTSPTSRRAEEFTADDEELVVGLAAAAGVAIENARLSTRVHELAVVEDRERIARDLHDTVIQRLFATGMLLQSTVRVVAGDPAASDRADRRGRRRPRPDDQGDPHGDLRPGAERQRAATALRGQILATVREAAESLGSNRG